MSVQNTLTTLLTECYDLASKHYGKDIESFDVVRSVDQHRLYWRPERVHTILLAESHVHTLCEQHVQMNGYEKFPTSQSSSNFVKFIYCLGYREPEYVGTKISKNNGTPQYWKFLSSSVEQPGEQSFAPFLKTHTPDFNARLSSKYQLLSRLKKDGVWLAPQA